MAPERRVPPSEPIACRQSAPDGEPDYFWRHFARLCCSFIDSDGLGLRAGAIAAGASCERQVVHVSCACACQGHHRGPSYFQRTEQILATIDGTAASFDADSVEGDVAEAALSGPQRCFEWRDY